LNFLGLFRQGKYITGIYVRLKNRAAILKIKDIKICASEFENLYEKPLEFSEPWHFNACRGEHPPFRGFPGVYLYAESPCPDWNLPFDESNADVWYIGKSETDVCRRIWSHVGTIYDGTTGRERSPRFAAHQWHTDQSVSSPIRSAIAAGEMVVYVIRVPSSDQPPGRSRALEAYLLSAFYAKNSTLPPLNSTI
jgi:hypothetical protein